MTNYTMMSEFTWGTMKQLDMHKRQAGESHNMMLERLGAQQVEAIARIGHGVKTHFVTVTYFVNEGQKVIISVSPICRTRAAGYWNSFGAVSDLTVTCEKCCNK